MPRWRICPWTRAGIVDPDDIRQAITDRTILVSVMHANNEVGTLQPIAEISRVAHERGVLFHSDAAQSVGKISTQVDELGVDLLSVAGHKFHGPKGVGALYIRQGVSLEPLVHGGDMKRVAGRGRKNVLLDVGLGAACARGANPPAQDVGGGETSGPALDEVAGIVWRTSRSQRPYWAAVAQYAQRFVRRPIGDGDSPKLPEVAASTGSACHDEAGEISPVLKAMGIPPRIAAGAIRFSLGMDTTQDEIQWVVGRIRDVIGCTQGECSKREEEVRAGP